ncbi:extracellular solute-binding protein [Paenibacillus sepulcri]|uniref:Extracellular solute-binding protein n=1 Tax=Paenibacillus sepulcri TaxID=359917 RepID=A0ABS7BVT1_9BACL|nr:extracellular solute-binding protein [Paenibacillus sepulcri]
MRRWTRMASVGLVVFLLAAVFAGCSQPEPAKNNAPAADAAANTGTADAGSETDAAAPDAKEPPVELTVLNAAGGSPTFGTGDPVYDDNPIAKYLLDNLNIKLKWEVISGDGAQAMGLKLASGDYPDIITNLQPETYQKMLDDNRLVDMAPLIEANGPNIQKAYGEKTLNFLKTDDNHLYSLTQQYGNIPEGSTPAGYGFGFQIRKDIYEAIGSPKIETTDDIYAVLKKIKDDPKVNKTGSGESVWPIGTFKRSWNNFLQGLEAMGGSGTAKWTVKDGKVQYWFREPWAETAMQFYNKLYREGLLDPDSFVVEPDAWQKEKVNTGRIATTIGAWNMVADAWGEFKAANVPNAENMYFLNFAVSIPGGETPQLVNISSVGNGYTVITDKTEDKEAAIKLLDFLASPEGNFMAHNGPEGTQWEMKDGVPTLKPEYLERWKNGEGDDSFAKETGIGLYRHFVGTDVPKSPAGTYMVLKDDPKVTGRVDFAQRDEALGKYYFDSAPFVGIETGLPQDITMMYSTIDSKLGDAVYKPVLANSAEASHEEWLKFIKAMDDAGAAKVEAAVTENYQKNLVKLGLK